MRQLIVILAAVVASLLPLTKTSAQNIRLGQPIPDMHTTLTDDQMEALGDKEFTCIIFVHSESTPCIDALSRFDTTAEALNNHSTLLILSNEEAWIEEILRKQIGFKEYTLAFDKDNRTFKAFGIRYVPFAVIYRTKNSRIEWFGPLHQLNATTLTKITKR
jgi:hypothetical protein